MEAGGVEGKLAVNGLPRRQVFTEYKVYPARWGLMGIVALLNLANYAHWIAFPAVAKKAAAYYQVTGDQLDMIPTVSYAAGIPTCLLATYIVESRGLRTGIRIGSFLTGFGGLLCCVSTFPGLAVYIPFKVQYWMALLGQAATGVACPFISCVPTKVSQHWFPDSQRTMATTILGMSYPLGIVIGQGLTPVIIQRPDQIPIMNIMFFIPAGIGAVLGLVMIKSSHPPTPANPSSQLYNQRKMNYWGTLKEVFTNKAFVIIFLFLGGAMSFISCLATKMEQIMCSVGYSDELAGLCCSLVILSGAFGTVMFGIAAEKTGKMVEITKLCCFGSIICILVLSYLLLIPDVAEYIIAACLLLGIFALGVFPLALELTVEATFPADQATVTCFIFLSSAIQGVILMVTENWLGDPLPEKYKAIETCSLSHAGEGEEAGNFLEAKDYTRYLLFVIIYLIVLVIIYMFFFKTELRRTNANNRGLSAQLKSIRSDMDFESLIPGGLAVVRASPRKRLITC